MKPISTSSKQDPNAEITVCLVAFGLVTCIAVAIDWSMSEPGMPLTREGGGIETMSALGYVMALGIYLRKRRGSVFWPIPVLLLALPAREIDADKAFTSEGILSFDILVHATPVYEKVLAVATWAVLASAITSLLRHRGLTFLVALRQGRAWSLAIASGIFLAAFSKSIDGFDRKLHPIGIHPSEAVGQGVGTLEEILELFIPAAFMVAILLLSRQDPRQPDTPRPNI